MGLEGARANLLQDSQLAVRLRLCLEPLLNVLFPLDLFPVKFVAELCAEQSSVILIEGIQTALLNWSEWSQPLAHTHLLLLWFPPIHKSKLVLIVTFHVCLILISISIRKRDFFLDYEVRNSRLVRLEHSLLILLLWYAWHGMPQLFAASLAIVRPGWLRLLLGYLLYTGGYSALDKFLRSLLEMLVFHVQESNWCVKIALFQFSWISTLVILFDILLEAL